MRVRDLSRTKGFATWIAEAALQLLLLAVLLSGAAGCRRDHVEAVEREVRVAAAADLKFAFDEVAQEFRKQHPGIKVIVTYGSSGNFYAQLTNKAPFDLFLSADVDYPRKLIEKGLAIKESEFLYAVGHIVVWVPNGSKLDLDKLGILAVLDPTIKKLAIANPTHAPYGRAAEAALKKLGVYDDVKNRLVIGDNIAQTAQFVESGSADAGIIALSLALAPAMRQKGRYWIIPLDAYPQLEQGGVILTWVKDKESTQTLRAFIKSTEGKVILKRFGFMLPGSPLKKGSDPLDTDQKHWDFGLPQGV
jgi:molybdate transport system substrate-binding protein